MLNLFKALKYFFIPSLAYILLGLVGLSIINKGDVVVWLSKQHGPLLDIVFTGLTYLGDGILIVIFIIGFLVWNRFYGLLFVLMVVPNALITQLLKRQVFLAPRPLKYLGEEFYVPVNGIVAHEHFAFPSGHTNGVFALMFTIALMSKNRWVQLSTACLAILTAVSRMYLYQHFLEDTVAGASLALVVCSLMYILVVKKTSLGSKLGL